MKKARVDIALVLIFVWLLHLLLLSLGLAPTRQEVVTIVAVVACVVIILLMRAEETDRRN